MSDEYWEIDYSPPGRAGRYDPIADHGRERPGYEVRWIPGTTDYEWVPVEPLYRIVWATPTPHRGQSLPWSVLLRYLREMSRTERQAVVRCVERVIPDA